ncbi:hypothetical protein G647_02823 [Cladophialophora carrionii CBS 160.54]|uniref:Cyclin-like domain-containing protein n=1 Tax=Cladophialophora carrionii CBS 160.54 TaxID=1279043 RepID=V9DH94_9EURO|nr:uncharacterized protein G647_02823 [Cladophialophora carrionii CBS 160.54]ETI26046.1 hypothetical protein G647_02823 [Cladophialophora carrionii CBS 160.54]
MPPVLKAPPPKPRPGQARRSIYRGRIEGLGSPVPTSLRASTPTLVRATTPAAQPQTRPKLLCPNPDCPDRSKVNRTDQGLICETCGALVQEDSGLVSEQGFGETDSGRIVATGVQVGQDQTHQRTFTSGGAFGNAGREATSSSDRTRMQARSIMTSYCPIFNIQSSEVERGMLCFGLAVTNGFLAGRTIESVAVASLYIACRRKKEQVQGVQRPVYSLMLIDFAEKLNMDVFALGKIYRDLYEKLWYDKKTGSWKDETASLDFQGMDPAVLVPKFIKELEFDRRDELKIQYDAIQIIKRMKRDWIHDGRRPSGVCGAAVLLAARMNNYRRTTREIVLTAKVTEITLNKRLQEFHDTKVSNLSVTSFMQEAKSWEDVPLGHHYLDEQQPPIVKEQMKPKQKRKRGRPRKRPLPETAAEIEGDTATTEPPTSNTERTHPAKRVRIDAQGYKIPEIPIRRLDAESLQIIDKPPTNPQPEHIASESLRGEAGSASEVIDDNADVSPSHSPSPPAGGEEANADFGLPRRKPRGPNWQPPPPSIAEIAMEAGIENAMDETFVDNAELSDRLGVRPSGVPRTDASRPGASDVDAQSPSRGQDDLRHEQMDFDTDPTQTVPPHQKDKTLGPPVNTIIGNFGHVSLSPTLKPDEFDSDEDVATCTLTEEESRIKERVWVSMNADWLRKDHAKRIRKELKDAEMRAKGLDPAEEERKKKAAKGKRKDGTRRPGRRGDVSYLAEQGRKRKAPADEGEGGGEGQEQEDGEADEADGGARPEEPRTAARAMRLMLENRRTWSHRINYDAVDHIFAATSTSEESAESRSATGDGQSRSGSVAASEGTQQTSREGSATGSPSASTPAAAKDSIPLRHTTLFRGNKPRGKRRGPVAAGQKEKERQARNAQKKAKTSEGHSGDRSASRSRSTSTPASAESGPSPEPQSPNPGQGEAPQQASTADRHLPTPPGKDTQLGPQIPGITTTAPVSTTLANHPGPQIPSLRSTAPMPTPPATQLEPTIPSIKSTGPQQVRSSSGGGPGKGNSNPVGRQGSQSSPSGEAKGKGDEQGEAGPEEDELEAALEGRYRAGNSEDEGEDEDDDEEDEDEDDEYEDEEDDAE